MSKYSKAYIYKIYASSYPEEVYIGSTTQPLYKRINDHKKNYRRWVRGQYRNCSVFRIFEKNDLQDCKIEALETLHDIEKKELHQREGEIQKQICCVNINIAGRDTKQWRLDNIEKVKMKNKENYEASKSNTLQKVCCEYCHKVICIHSLKRHFKTCKKFPDANSK